MAGMSSVGISVLSDRAYHMERVLRYWEGVCYWQTWREQVLHQDQGSVGLQEPRNWGLLGYRHMEWGSWNRAVKG